MVCRARQGNVVTVMSNTHHARDVVIACKNSISKMQSVADLLLLSNNNIRPVVIDSVTQLSDAYPQCRESIVTQMKGLLVLTSHIQGYLQNTTSKWNEICKCIRDITEVVVTLTELCSDAAYLCVLSKPSCLPLIPGIVDSYKVSRANLEIHLSCQQIQQLSYTELTPPLLVQLCYSINQNLAILTECCKRASERTNDQHNEEQFKLCTKSFTACGSCVVSSIKSFKAQPSEATRQRCVRFCEALSASTDALVGFATESQFGWKAGTITPQAEEAKKAILGASLNLMSACVQLMRVVKELSYNQQNITYRERLHHCIAAIAQSSSQLTDTLRQYLSQQDRFHVGHSASPSTAPRICDNYSWRLEYGSCSASVEALSSVSTSANDMHTGQCLL